LLVLFGMDSPPLCEPSNRPHSAQSYKCLKSSERCKGVSQSNELNSPAAGVTFNVQLTTDH
jgi:hypothetical protein